MNRIARIAPVLALSTLFFGTIALADIVLGSSTTNISTDITLTQVSLTKPPSTASGDLLLASISVNGGSSVSITPPTGWTLIKRADNETNIGVATYYLVAGASEPTSYVWNISPQARAVGGITRYGGVDTSNPIDVSGSATGHGTTATAPSVTTALPNERLVTVFATNAGNILTPTFTTATGMTKEYDAKNTPQGPTTAAESQARTTAGATGSTAVTVSQLVQRDWVAQTITLRIASQGIVDGFESYLPGTSLASQSGGSGWTGAWSGDSRYLIGSSISYEGSQAITLDVPPADQPTLSRSFPSKTVGTIHWAQRKDGPDNGQNVSVYSGNTLAFYIGLGSSAQPQAGGPDWTGSDGNLWFIIKPYTVSSWDTVDAQFDTNTDMYRVSISGGAYSEWKPFANAVAGIDTIELGHSGSGGNVGINYWDDFRIVN